MNDQHNKTAEEIHRKKVRILGIGLFIGMFGIIRGYLDALNDWSSNEQIIQNITWIILFSIAGYLIYLGFWKTPEPKYKITIPKTKEFKAWCKLIDKALNNYDSLTKNERIEYNVKALIGEINNGGFISHYYNPGADKNRELIEDLKTIGALDIVEILEVHNNLFPKGKPSRDTEERNKVIDNWPKGTYEKKSLEDYDRKFYDKLEKKLEEKLERYLVKCSNRQN